MFVVFLLPSQSVTFPSLSGVCFSALGWSTGCSCNGTLILGTLIHVKNLFSSDKQRQTGLRTVSLPFFICFSSIAFFSFVVFICGRESSSNCLLRLDVSSLNQPRHTHTHTQTKERIAVVLICHSLVTHRKRDRVCD